MNLEIKLINDTEFAPYLRAVARGFGHHMSDDAMWLYKRILEQGRMLGALDGGEFVGGSAVYPLEMTVPGGAMLSTGLVDSVSVQPTHRRRGILRQMMEYHLRDIHQRGEILSALGASESTIYGRFGYGVGTLSERWEIERHHADFAHTLEMRGSVRFIDKEKARKLFPEVFYRACWKRPGFISANEGLWDIQLADPETWRRGASAYFHVVYEEDGRIDGYVSYRIRDEGQLLVPILVAASREAHSALWRYCFGVDLMASIEAYKRPLDDPLPWMLKDPRKLRRSVRDDMWLRLVDVPAALAARRYAGEGRLVLEVRDSFCPWNDGRYALTGGPEGAECKPTTESPEISLSATDLATAYLGAVRFITLSQAGRVGESVPGSLQRADAMFMTQVQPWWPVEF